MIRLDNIEFTTAIQHHSATTYTGVSFTSDHEADKSEILPFGDDDSNNVFGGLEQFLFILGLTAIGVALMTNQWIVSLGAAVLIAVAVVFLRCCVITAQKREEAQGERYYENAKRALEELDSRSTQS